MNDVAEVGRWMASTPTDGWFNPFDDHWRIRDIVDADSTRWNEHANCLDVPDPDIFFEVERQLDRPRLNRICEPCPVQADCLAYALDSDVWGWWGNASVEDRKKIRKQARDGR